ncbi:hypothetical protein EG68_09168 [Paragonimus skrjabini miyazakii]|uniref:Mannosyltransferase n=1 Tax=Paragonimus skrjabini miyazakii TaxID=59628 RepID=A0A8S9YKM5_9TREM|nr:hypothetical protein EG68_09168 [Paragonimus skrjabini miyazakii]
MQKSAALPAPRVAGWTFYFVLLFLRLGLVIRVQPGYIHPDEFFQSLEVAAGDVYGLDVYRPWEFLSGEGGPLRSFAGIYPLVHFPIWLYRRLLDGPTSIREYHFAFAPS